MATPHGGPRPSKIIGSISKVAGAFVGNAVVTGKRVISSVAPLSEGLSGKQRKKTIKKAPATKKKKVSSKDGAKAPKTKKKKKKKKMVKGTGSSAKSRVSKKKATKSSAKKSKKSKKTKKTKKKKGATYRRKTAAKQEEYNSPQDGLISEIDTGGGVPIEEQESQGQMSIVSSESDIEQDVKTFD